MKGVVCLSIQNFLNKLSENGMNCLTSVYFYQWTSFIRVLGGLVRESYTPHNRLDCIQFISYSLSPAPSL